MSKWWNLKQAWVIGGSNCEPRLQPNVSTSPVDRVRVAPAVAARLVMLHAPACAAAVAVVMAWLDTAHVTSVELRQEQKS